MLSMIPRFRQILTILLIGVVCPMTAQRRLSLDSCLVMALNNNKQMGVAQLKKEMAVNMRKAARTKYLPHVQAMGGYLYSSKTLSLLSDEQKSKLSQLGTSTVQGVGQLMPNLAASLTPAQAGQMANILNGEGQSIVNAFETNTHHIFGATMMVSQPLYVGGVITAMNRLADLNEQLSKQSAEAVRQNTLFQTEQTYWNVVSLIYKQRLAEDYLNLVKKLDEDIQKMIAEGVATRADGLNVAVKANEAEMTLIQVNDGLSLTKMLLCQLCGLPVDEDILPEDGEEHTRQAIEKKEVTGNMFREMTAENRPELQMLETTIGMTQQTTKLMKAGNLPKVALVGGYSVSNPHVFDGFHREFSGMWNVGVLVSVPVWNWGEVAYKTRASKNATAMARLEFEDAKEKVGLQVSQSRLRVNEAQKKYNMAENNIRKAEENLRCANLGFKEGVMTSTTVMEAQTAWLKARSQMIDAEIAVRLSESDLKKSLGVLTVNQ